MGHGGRRAAAYRANHSMQNLCVVISVAARCAPCTCSSLVAAIRESEEALVEARVRALEALRQELRQDVQRSLDSFQTELRAGQAEFRAGQAELRSLLLSLNTETALVKGNQ